MKRKFTYRSYEISPDHGRFVARPLDGEDDEFVSKRLNVLIKAIDTLWECLEDIKVIPAWFTPGKQVDLDLATHIHGDGNIEPFPVSPRINTSQMALVATKLIGFITSLPLLGYFIHAPLVV